MDETLPSFLSKVKTNKKVQIQQEDNYFIDAMQLKSKSLLQKFTGNLKGEFDSEEIQSIGTICLGFCNIFIESLKLGTEREYLDIEHTQKIKRVENSKSHYLDKNLQYHQKIIDLIQQANILRENIQNELAKDMDQKVKDAFHMRDSKSSSQTRNSTLLNKRLESLVKSETAEIECVYLVLKNLTDSFINAKRRFEEKGREIDARLGRLKFIFEADGFSMNEFDKALCKNLK